MKFHHREEIRYSIDITHSLSLRAFMRIKFTSTWIFCLFRHVYLPGEIAMFRHYSSGKRKRPVLILSSSNHNQFQNGTLLIVPFTTKYPNSTLYQWKIFPEETCHRSVVEHNSILIFDYSTSVEYEELETTLDPLKSDPFMATIKCWKQIVNSILPWISWTFSRFIVLASTLCWRMIGK